MGLNATGESDNRNYAIHIAAIRVKFLKQPFGILDRIRFLNLGIKKPLQYVWPELTDISQSEQSIINATDVKTMSQAVAAGVMTREEMRKQLSGRSLFGILDGQVELQKEIGQNLDKKIKEKEQEPEEKKPKNKDIKK